MNRRRLLQLLALTPLAPLVARALAATPPTPTPSAVLDSSSSPRRNRLTIVAGQPKMGKSLLAAYLGSLSNAQVFDASLLSAPDPRYTIGSAGEVVASGIETRLLRGKRDLILTALTLDTYAPGVDRTTESVRLTCGHRLMFVADCVFRICCFRSDEQGCTWWLSVLKDRDNRYGPNYTIQADWEKLEPLPPRFRRQDYLKCDFGA